MPSISLHLRRDPWWEMDGPAARAARRRRRFVAFVAFVAALGAVGGAAFAWAVQLGLAGLLGVSITLAGG